MIPLQMDFLFNFMELAVKNVINRAFARTDFRAKSYTEECNLM